jgi:hypothetical protein
MLVGKSDALLAGVMATIRKPPGRDQERCLAEKVQDLLRSSEKDGQQGANGRSFTRGSRFSREQDSRSFFLFPAVYS